MLGLIKNAAAVRHSPRRRESTAAAVLLLSIGSIPDRKGGNLELEFVMVSSSACYIQRPFV